MTKVSPLSIVLQKIDEFGKQKIGVAQVQNDKLYMEPLVEAAQQI